MSGAIYAFGGKGGSGKATLAALVLRQLVKSGHRPILAVDADPNATLGATLGVKVSDTIADLRDRMGEAAETVSEIPKHRLMDQWLAELLTEQEGFDLLTMGRPEGPRCYCYVNSLLRRYLKELRANYAAVIVDCTAGMEYFSRLTIDDVDTLFLVAEATPIGLASAGRIARLADGLPVSVRKRVLVLNKIGQLGMRENLAASEHPKTVDATIHVPFDEDIYQRCVHGEAIDAEAGTAIRPVIDILTRICLKGADPRRKAPIHKEFLK